jgi:PIN domain nuclease of toxin-antitoxin system
VAVTAHYNDGTTDSVELIVHFVPPEINPILLPVDVEVTIPTNMVALESRMSGYNPPPNLTIFDDSYFQIAPRSTVEYVLTVAASIQKDFANDDVFQVDGAFNQVLLRDPEFGGMYSLWYTSPVSFGVNNTAFQGTIQWSSFLHEMGHNVTLNTPADYYYGGKIDGRANAIFSESMAQIFAHATAYYMLNHTQQYGLSDDLSANIKQSVISSMQIVKNFYEEYLSSGKNFTSWSDQQTDETLLTFMTIAYKFFEHAENSSLGYRTPLKRMMTLLQTFNEDMEARYDRNRNTPEAETFRATLMVTALSYAFETDLRQEFRNLNFPISDDLFGQLYNF